MSPTSVPSEEMDSLCALSVHANAAAVAAVAFFTSFVFVFPIRFSLHSQSGARMLVVCTARALQTPHSRRRNRCRCGRRICTHKMVKVLTHVRSVCVRFEFPTFGILFHFYSSFSIILFARSPVELKFKASLFFIWVAFCIQSRKRPIER